MRTPLLLWVILFVLAVLTAPWVNALPICLFWTVALAALLALLLFRRSPALRLLFLSLALLTLSWAWVRVADPVEKPSHYLHIVENSPSSSHSFLGEVKDYPHPRKEHLEVLFDLQCLDGQNATGTLQVWLPRDARSESLVPGDQLLIHAPLTPFNPPATPYQSDYRKRMQRQHIYLQCWVSEGSWQTLEHSPRPLRDHLHTLRQTLTDKIRHSTLTQREKGVAEALLLGDKNNLDGDLYRQYKEAGIAHLLCVSGLHVGLVALIVSRLLFFLSYTPRTLRLRCDIQLLVVWLFTLLTGSAPSTLRAAIMFSFLFLAKRKGNSQVQVNTLLASALLQMFCNPSVLYDVGFQLSYSALLGILLMGIPLTHHFPWRLDFWSTTPLQQILHTLLQRLYQWTVVSISAELWTLPWILIYFHQFPTYFLIANLTVVPLAGLLLTFLLLFLICGEKLWLGHIALRFASSLLGWSDALTQWETQLPGAVADNLYCDWGLFLLLTLTIGCLTIAVYRWHLRPLWASSVALFLSLVYWTVGDLSRRSQSGFILYATPYHTVLELIEGKQSLLLLDQRTHTQPEKIDFQRQGVSQHYALRQTQTYSLDHTASLLSPHFSYRDHLLTTPTCTLAIVTQQNATPTQATTTPLDYLLVTENAPVSVQELQSHFRFDTLLISPNNSPLRQQEWQSQCQTLRQPYRIQTEALIVMSNVK